MFWPGADWGGACARRYVAPGADPCMMVAVLIDSKVQGGKSVEEYVNSKRGKLVGGSVPSKL